MRVQVALGVAALVVSSGCGSSDNDNAADAATTSESGQPPSHPASDERFCEAMEHLIVLLAPSGPTSPADTEAIFAEAASWFAQANDTAPAAISGDFASYSAAYDEYVRYLSTVGFNLDTVFSTDEGRQLAIDTSHTLTPAIVEHVTETCGLSFGDESNKPPES